MATDDVRRQFKAESLRVMVLESDLMRVEILPEIGGKIYSIFYKPAEEDILWHNPAIEPHRTAATDSYDDHWAGGWDDLFPNDESAFADSWAFPDHGELWAAAWNGMIEPASDGAPIAHLAVDCPRSKVRVQKQISLGQSTATIKVRFQLTSLNSVAIPFLFKLHPALIVRPGDRISIPAKEFLLEPRFLGTLGEGEVSHDGPLIARPGRIVDLQAVPPPDSKDLFFAYGTELTSGSAVLESESRGLKVALRFPPDFFRCCWLFASYGGWNNYYVAVLEPCNGYPFRLEEAMANDRAGWLEPGAQVVTEVEMRISDFGTRTIAPF